MTPQGESVQLHFLAPDLASELAADPRVRAWLEDGLAYSDVGQSFEQVIARLLRGELRGLLVRIAAESVAMMVLEIAVAGNPPRKTLSVLVAGGERMHDWIHSANVALKDIAGAVGCERVAVIGRPGWERHLRQIGWKKTGCIMETAATKPGARAPTSH